MIKLKILLAYVLVFFIVVINKLGQFIMWLGKKLEDFGYKLYWFMNR